MYFIETFNIIPICQDKLRVRIRLEYPLFPMVESEKVMRMVLQKEILPHPVMNWLSDVKILPYEFSMIVGDTNELGYLREI